MHGYLMAQFVPLPQASSVQWVRGVEEDPCRTPYVNAPGSETSRARSPCPCFVSTSTFGRSWMASTSNHGWFLIDLSGDGRRTVTTTHPQPIDPSSSVCLLLLRKGLVGVAHKRLYGRLDQPPRLNRDYKSVFGEITNLVKK